MILTCDTETECFGRGRMVPPLVCVTWAMGDEEAPHIAKWDTPGLRDVVEEWLTEDIIIDGANTAYEMAQFVNRWPDLTTAVWRAYGRGAVRDVLIDQKLLDISTGEYASRRKRKRFAIDDDDDEEYDPEDADGGEYSLQGVYYRYTKLILPKDGWRLRYAELRDVPLEHWPADAIGYAKDDTSATRIVRRYIDDAVTCDELVDSARQARAGWWLYLTSAWGFQTDPARVREYSENIWKLLNEYQEELTAAGLLRRDKRGVYHRNTKVAQARMVSLVAKPKLTKKQGICLDKEACRNSCDDLLIRYSEASSLSKLAATDIPILLQGTVHTSFEVLQETGRTGSFKPNMQNLPRVPGVRECYTARPGFYLVDCDYDIAELRALAQICIWTVGYSVLGDVLNKDGDPHLHMGAAIGHIPYDEAKANPKKYKELRQKAKAVNFGVPGGQGAEGIRVYAKTAYDVVMSIEEAASYRELFLNTYPEVREYFRLIREQLPWRMNYAQGCDTTSLKHFVSGRYRGNVRYTQAANSFFQGLVADMAKATGFIIARECYDPSLGSVLYGSRIVAFIHDQWLTESPIPVASECAMRVGSIMREESRNWIPDVPATVTPALCRRFSKATEAVYDRPGHLIPYEDKVAVAA